MHHFFFATKRQAFDKDKVTNFKYVGREDFTEHAHDTQVSDYIGLKMGEYGVQYFIEGGNLSFFYNGGEGFSYKKICQRIKC